jgi:hypothetical protein
MNLVCSNCGATEGVQLEDSRTCYAPIVRTRWQRILEPDPPDPNAPIPYCRPCAKLHHEWWDEEWKIYNSLRG